MTSCVNVRSAVAKQGKEVHMMYSEFIKLAKINEADMVTITHCPMCGKRLEVEP